jgi:predicted nucleic acid-binding protein
MSADFLDSNILVYLTSGDAGKASIVETLLADEPVVSAQVLNEVTNVLRSKMRFDWPAVDHFIERIVYLTSVLPMDQETNGLARSLAARYGFAWYDALIVASALEGGCTRLLTEDMHHGLKISDLTIANPFR